MSRRPNYDAKTIDEIKKGVAIFGRAVGFTVFQKPEGMSDAEFEVILRQVALVAQELILGGVEQQKALRAVYRGVEAGMAALQEEVDIERRADYDAVIAVEAGLYSHNEDPRDYIYREDAQRDADASAELHAAKRQKVVHDPDPEALEALKRFEDQLRAQRPPAYCYDPERAFRAEQFDPAPDYPSSLGFFPAASGASGDKNQHEAGRGNRKRTISAREVDEYQDGTSSELSSDEAAFAEQLRAQLSVLRDKEMRYDVPSSYEDEGTLSGASFY